MAALDQFLKIDKGKPSDFPVCMILTGEQGSGKSFNVAAAFPDYLYIQSRPTSLFGLEDWCVKNDGEAKKRGIRLPENRMTKVAEMAEMMKLDADGNLEQTVDFDLFTWWLGFWNAWFLDGREGKNPYQGVVVDELNNFLDAIAAQKKRTSRNKFAVIDHVKQAELLPLVACRTTRKDYIAIMHWDGVKYVQDAEDGSSKKPNAGEVEYPAGPAYPYGTMRREASQRYDAIWQFVVKGTAGSMPRREIFIQPSTNEIRKPGYGTKKSKIVLDDKTTLREAFSELRAMKKEENLAADEGDSK